MTVSNLLVFPEGKSFLGMNQSMKQRVSNLLVFPEGKSLEKLPRTTRVTFLFPIY